MLTDWIADRRGGTAVFALIYLLAVLDAIAVPALIMWWLWKQPLHAGPFGITGAVLLTLWGAKRAGRALFDFDNYDWMIAKLGKWVLVLAVVGVVAKVWVMAGR